MRRFLSFNDFFREYFNGKTVKLSLDGGFTCPNRDGLISNRGCIFCTDKGSGEFAGDRKNSLNEQIDSQKSLLKNKWNAENYIAYFQNFTNTYGDLSYIKSIYNEVINRKDIKGISIATRCDCLDKETIKYLKEISNKKFLWLELGMQTTNENTIKLINRGYSHEVFDQKIEELKDNNILFLLHVIFGLPYEDENDFKNTIDYVKRVYPFGVKFHNLYICKNTDIYIMYKKEKFKLIPLDEYIKTVIYAIENMPRNTVIHRITGDPDKKSLYEPKWCLDKLSVISKIDKTLKDRNVPVKTKEDIKIAADYWKQ